MNWHFQHQLCALCRPRASGGPELGLFREALQRLQSWAQAQPAPQPVGTAAARRLRLPELISLRGFLPLALAGLTADTPPPDALDFVVQPTNVFFVHISRIRPKLARFASAQEFRACPDLWLATVYGLPP